MRIFCSAKDSHIFPTKNNSVFVTIMFENLTNNVVNYEQPGPDVLREKPAFEQVYPGLKIESLRLPKCCLGLSNNNLEGPTGLLKIVKEFTF